MHRNVFERLEGRVLFSTLPAGFTETTVATLPAGTHPTMAFAPDGRLFVADTTNNQIRLIKGGALQSTPVLNLTVSQQSERGINGIAFDPNFASAPVGQKYVYVYYTTPAATPVNRLSRFTISTSNADTLDPTSEKILIDNIASTNGNHNGGSLHFGADGKLYLGVGEAGVSSNAQTLANDNGKILRINPDGTIPADNPFVGTPGAKGEIWALGFRNPFTSAFKPGTSQLYVNDVGEHTFEEINLVQKGGNFGWPTVEGPGSSASFVNPIYTYQHAINASAAITGGVFYNGGNFPASYNGKYFFADFILHKIWTIDVNSPPASGAATVFASNTLGTVDLDVNPVDGTLWYLDVGGKVQRIAFNQNPPNTTTITSTSAAYVKDGSSASTNFGQAADLQVKKSTPGFNRESFIKFDLSQVGTIGSAKLRVFGKLSSAEAASAGLSIFPVSSTMWDENALTFNNKPAAGASAIATGTITGTTGQWYEFDVTAYAKANAGKVVSFDLRGTNPSLPIMTFNSDEAATNKPQLVISASSTGTSLSDTADAYVRDGSSANTNFGSATGLQVKKSTPGFTREAYLRFDLSSVSTINSAKLRLFGGFEAAPSSPVRIAAFGLDNPTWSESAITYNNRPTGGTQLSVVTFTDGAQATREWNLTSYLKAQKAAGHNIVTIALRALDGSTPAASFASDEAAANRPALVIS